MVRVEGLSDKEDRRVVTFRDILVELRALARVGLNPTQAGTRFFHFARRGTRLSLEIITTPSAMRR